MKKKIFASLIVLTILIGISSIVMAAADEYLLEEYRRVLNGMIINMVWVGVVIIASIVGLVAIGKLKKKERIKPALNMTIKVILIIVLIFFVCYEGKLLWDYGGVKPAYDYLQDNEKIGE